MARIVANSRDIDLGAAEGRDRRPPAAREAEDRDSRTVPGIEVAARDEASLNGAGDEGRYAVRERPGGRASEDDGRRAAVHVETEMKVAVAEPERDEPQTPEPAGLAVRERTQGGPHLVEGHPDPQAKLDRVKRLGGQIARARRRHGVRRDAGHVGSAAAAAPHRRPDEQKQRDVRTPRKHGPTLRTAQARAPQSVRVGEPVTRTEPRSSERSASGPRVPAHGSGAEGGPPGARSAHAPPARIRYVRRMRTAVRVGFVVLGAATAVYGAASLTGGWLGAPPWWDRPATQAEEWDLLARWAIEVGTSREPGPMATLPGTDVQIPLERPFPKDLPPRPSLRVAREDREAMSAAVVGLGLAAATIGAWPRRRRVNVGGPRPVTGPS